MPVATLPRARTTVRSLTGSHGSRSGRRVQTGISPIAAATRAPYAGRAAQRQLRVPDQERDRLAGVVGGRAARAGRPRAPRRSSRLGASAGRRRRAARADLASLGDVRVAADLVQGRRAVDLVGPQEAVDLGHVHPGQQVRVGGGVRVPSGIVPVTRSWIAAHQVDRRLGVLDRHRRWSPRGTARSAPAAPTCRRGIRSARTPPASPRGAASGGSLHASPRRTSTRRRAPERSHSPRSEPARPRVL